MGMLWVILFPALTGLHLIQGLPLKPSPQSYLHASNQIAAIEGWGAHGMYILPALALVATFVGILFGCTWCYKHKDRKLFVANASIVHARCAPPDSGFSEPANNNISEDNNNGPISLREMQNIANNNAAAYIVSENEERNRISRESVVEFEPLPESLSVLDPLERCADWFGGEDLPRNRLQYLRELGRGWFGRVVEGELEDGTITTVAVKILNQNASLEDKARFLDEAKIYRDSRHENILAFIAKCLQEDPWMLLFELCSMDLQQYLVLNRPKMAILNESGVPLQLMCDVTSALGYMHSRGFLYGNLWSGSVLVREGEVPRAVLGQYGSAEPHYDCTAPETRRHPPVHTSNSEVWSLGMLIWEICAWGSSPPSLPPPLPDLPCPYRTHLYQVMQLCWNTNPDSRPSAAQVHALLNHLHNTQVHSETTQDDGYGSSDFEERWQRLKPNTIPKIDEHVAIVHAPSTSMTSHFTGSDQDFDNHPTTQDTISLDLDTAVSRSSSIMSDKDPLSVQIKSESMTNLHGSLEDVRNIYLTHNETAAIECHQGNVGLDDSKDKDNDHSDSSMDPWLKDIIAGSQDDVSYFKDVSDVIKNLDNILNSEKTSSSESSSPSRDNLILECKKDYPMQKSMVKSPGITNFQNIMHIGFDSVFQSDACDDNEDDRDSLGTLSHSFERHTDSISQHTLENITPETPVKDLDIVKSIDKTEAHTNVKHDNFVADLKEELPKHKIEHNISNIPMLKELCIASMPSISKTIVQQLNVREDCHTPCDNKLTEVRIDINDIGTKLVDDIMFESEEKSSTDSATLPLTTEIETTQETDSNSQATKSNEEILPVEEHLQTVREDMMSLVINDIIKENLQEKKGDCITLGLDQVGIIACTNSEESCLLEVHKLEAGPLEDITQSNTNLCIENEKGHITPESEVPPETVQNLVKYTNNHVEKDNLNEFPELATQNVLYNKNIAPEIVQSNSEQGISNGDDILIKDSGHNVVVNAGVTPYRSDVNEKAIKNVFQESTNDNIDIDLINGTTTYDLKESNVNKSNVFSYYLQTGTENKMDFDKPLFKDDSTVYLDLPSIIKETSSFLNIERTISDQTSDFKVVSSTPLGSDGSFGNTLETSNIEKEIDQLSEIIVQENNIGVTFNKFVEGCVPQNISPLESPTKSQHTDTYDENSSVVLGSFENCSLELYKTLKPEMVDLPKEELLVFSSNFSEIDLETPSPLRDGNFLNEVPDIVHDDSQFNDLSTKNESQPENVNEQSDNSENTYEISNTEKRVSPSTPPNSPGVFLATLHNKYLVDIDLSTPIESVPHTSASTATESAPQLSDSGLSSLQKEIDLNQIELHMTAKLAMAENENNMNIEYSGPLSVDGFLSEDDVLMRERAVIPELYLAGNGTQFDNLRGFALDEECEKALRNELELKLPLAQVAAIEPAVEVESECGVELPPPPDLVLSYPCNLSPIAEETRQQLSAYEDDTHWNISTRTESSESYPEPCNNSADEVTDLPTGVQSGEHENPTYTVHSRDNSYNHTYTLQRDIETSKEMTMSADSLNASPVKKLKEESLSPVDDRIYNKWEDEKVSNCEQLSQVSPFLLSPTTDTSAPENSDNFAGCSTLSKPTLPTEAQSSKPSETQCLSKATSIDSWCSNDTLYNVEENFDDLAMDSDSPVEFGVNEEPEKDDKSESTDTLTHNEDEKELSHCSTYKIHDSKSELEIFFPPYSITAINNNTNIKPESEGGANPSINIKSEIDDCTKNAQGKDVPYASFMSELPSYSNCTKEAMSIDDKVWKVAQPELVRRSPVGHDFNITPPKTSTDEVCIETKSPKTNKPIINKMDSMEATCLKDSSDSENKSEMDRTGLLLGHSDDREGSRNLANFVTSTPLTEVEIVDDVKGILFQLPNIITEDDGNTVEKLPNNDAFLQCAEKSLQDISTSAHNETTESNLDTELLESENKSISSDKNNDNLEVIERPLTYSDFENSVICKSQELNSRDRWTTSASDKNSEDFRIFENSASNRPQDLSSAIGASALFLTNEIGSSGLTTECSTSMNQPCQSESLVNDSDTQSLVISPLYYNIFVTDLDYEEMEQPHSIIITESPLLVNEHSSSCSKTHDSNNVNVLYDSNELLQPLESDASDVSKVNGIKSDSNTVEIKNSSDSEVASCNNTDNSKINRDKNDHRMESNLLKVKKDLDNRYNKDASQNYATVNFLNEAFEELLESNVDDNDSKDLDSSTIREDQPDDKITPAKDTATGEHHEQVENIYENIKQYKAVNGAAELKEEKLTSVTDDFLQNEKKFCQLDSYFSLLSDIKFTGPGAEITSTSFNQDSPTTEPTSPECEQDSKPDTATDILKEWESDSDSHSTNSSSGEFIWKDGDGHVTSVVTSTRFDHQREGGSQAQEGPELSGSVGNASSGSDGSEGSEGDEVEFVPSSWDCRAAPAKSSLRSLEQAAPDSKKRVVFKRQKYHCVYEYPREVAEADAESPAYLPDFSTYSDWDPATAEDAELGYGQLFGAPNPLDLFSLRAGIAFGTDYDEDFFISSSARPFESLGVMSTTSQFFPGMHVKPSLLERDIDDLDGFPPPPSPLPPMPLAQTKTPSLDFTTPDSGVEDITPGSTSTEDDFKTKKVPDNDACWRPVDSASSSESVSPSSPGGEALGGLRHTRDKLKLDLPPSPHIASPRHNRVFNFVLDKPKRRSHEERSDVGTTPLVMTDETPIITTSLPVHKETDDVIPEPTFSTFGKCATKVTEPEQKAIILTDDVQEPEKEEDTANPKVEVVKGEGTVLDSGDEDSGIESSSKATLERNKTTPNIS